MQTNCLARATLVKSMKVDKQQFYKLKVAFNVTEVNTKGLYIFPVQRKCAYVSGDITLDELGRVLVTVQKVLRTTNVELV